MSTVKGRGHLYAFFMYLFIRHLTDFLLQFYSTPSAMCSFDLQERKSFQSWWENFRHTSRAFREPIVPLLGWASCRDEFLWTCCAEKIPLILSQRSHSVIQCFLLPSNPWQGWTIDRLGIIEFPHFGSNSSFPPQYFFFFLKLHLVHKKCYPKPRISLLFPFCFLQTGTVLIAMMENNRGNQLVFIWE